MEAKEREREEKRERASRSRSRGLFSSITFHQPPSSNCMRALSLLSNPVFFPAASTRAAPASRVVPVTLKRAQGRPLPRPASSSNADATSSRSSIGARFLSSSSFPRASSSSSSSSSPTMAPSPPPPTSTSVGTLFLGGGNAAGYFAAEYDKIVAADPSLKESAFGGSIAVVSGERSVSYERPALSKGYLFPKSPARLPGFHACVGGGGERQEAAWYEEKGIRYKLGSEATRVDAAARTVTLADGSVFKYHKLVVATGCRPVDLARDLKMPGAAAAEAAEEGGGGAAPPAENVFYLRDVVDADRLYSALEKAAVAAAASAAAGSDGSGAARPLVIGGGYIPPPKKKKKKKKILGLELAAALVGWGLKPVVAFPEDRLLARILTRDAAAFYSKFYELKGAELRPGVSVKALERGSGGDAQNIVSAAALSDGTSLPVSLVVVGVGARPRTELFEGEGGDSQIAVVGGAPGGVLVDSRLRSVSAPGVWACGDVAAFPSSCLSGSAEGSSSQPTRQEHVQHARSSAAFVARDIARFAAASGSDAAANADPAAAAAAAADAPSYSYLPYYYSRVFDLGWVFYGSPSSSSSSETVEFGERDAEAAAKGEKQTFGSFHLEAADDGSGKKMIVGAFLEGGSPEQNAVIKKLVEARALVEGEGEGSSAAKLGIEWASATAAKL